MVVYTPFLISLLACLSRIHAQDVIRDDTVFYGQSPLVEPPIANGTGSWAGAYEKARALVGQMSLEEKVNLTGGVSFILNSCSGNIPPVESVGFPGLCLTDAGQGVRATDFVSGFASGISVGASWNKDLANARAFALGAEFYKKGVNLALGPVVGPLGRIAEGGRNWEAFSNDPYLSGKLVAETVEGIQSSGVIAVTKHFVANEQELNRNPTTNANNETVESSSSNMDDKTMHELYLWPFQDAVHAGTGSIMCSYQRLNNSYGCHNSKSQNGLLKTELGFEGFVVSDWFAQHAGVASANGGLDMVMPTGATFWAGNLTQAVRNGSVSEERMDDMATRIIAAWYQLGQDDGTFENPGIGMPYLLNTTHEIVDARDASARPTLLQSAIESHVLVKNVNNALPLQSPKLLSLYGYSARAAGTNNPTAMGFGDWSLGAGSTEYGVSSLVCGFGRPGECPPLSAIAPNGTLIVGGGSGAITPSYISDPHSALVEYGSENGIALFWDYQNVNTTGFVHGMTDACLVFINAYATEGVDRPSLDDEYSDLLVNNIADQCSNTIVVIHNAGIRIVDGFYDHPNVTGIIYAHLPGQDSGKATVSVLFGEVSPSGKMPYTVARKAEDYGSVLNQYQPGTVDQYFPQDDFSEGSLIDYRAFDAMGIEPRFEFGFGLSYGNFSYSNLQVSASGNGSMGMYPTGEIVQGGRTDLWDVVATVSCDVMNSGSMEAAEVAQLYLTIPGMTINIPSQAAPVGQQLRGFDKQTVAPGAGATFTFELTRRDISVWDVVAQEWAVNAGTYTVEVGSSSRNLPLSGSMTM